MRRVKLFGRALLSNAVNAVSKDLHSALRRASGRGDEVSTPRQVAEYFRGCFDDYLAQLGVVRAGANAFLRGRTVLEYGPGDLPAVPLLMIAHGAERAVCTDRFPWLRLSEVNRAAVGILAAELGEEGRERLASCFTEPSHGGSLRPERIRYVVSRDGLSGLRAEADLVVSRSVLEHVNRLDATLEDVVRALKPGAPMIHKVDLRSHGFEWGHPLDFLTVGEPAWRLLSSHNGSMPNRLRLSDYRRLLSGLPLDGVSLEPTVTIPAEHAESARPRLARAFASRSIEDLTVLGFWLRAARRMDPPPAS